jgi:cytochrome P450
VVACGPEAAQEVIENRDKAFGQGWHHYIGAFFPRGLLLLDFDEHIHNRRIMQAAFTRSLLAQYVLRFTERIEATIAGWPTNRPIPLYQLMRNLTLAIAADVFMNTSEKQDRLNDAFLGCMRATLSLIRADLPRTRWRAGKQGRRQLEDHFYQLLSSKRDRGGDLFTAVCEARTESGERFGDIDIVNHMIFLIMAAHDTATTTANAAAYFLGKCQDWQDRSRQACAANWGAPNMEALEAMVDLDLVIKESLRIIAPVPALARRTVKDTSLLGHFVPGGISVDVPIWINHFLQDYWTYPNKFDPMRFHESRREDKAHRFAYLPFGAGPHKCIGMHFGILEVKAILSAMLRRFDWTVADDYKLPWGFTSIPFPKDDFPIVLRPRKRDFRTLSC